MALKLHASLIDMGLKTKIKRLKASVRGPIMTKAVRAGGLALIGWIKVNINNRGLIDTGNLINSVLEDQFGQSGLSAWVTVGPHVVYAAIHEFGGVIRPTNGPYLVFQTDDGNWVATRSVTIPARPYVRPAIDEHGGEIVETIAFILRDELQKEWDANGR